MKKLGFFAVRLRQAAGGLTLVSLMRHEVFTHILGQEGAQRILARALVTGRIHHAWIFHGGEGVGKRTTAVAIAAALLDGTMRAEPDGAITVDEASETRRLIEAGTHPDLRVITKELARYSDDRATRERKLISIPKQVIEEHLLAPASRAATAPSEGALAKKVFIVDEAELLNLETQNAMLKTLEEPPAGTVIILVTSLVDRLLPTIRSRCQRVPFVALDEESMRAWFSQWSGKRDGSVSDEEAELALLLAEGSSGRAAMVIETGLAQWWRELAPMLDRIDQGRFPAQLGATMTKLVDDWAKAWVDSHENASKDAANKAGAANLFRLLAGRARRRLASAEQAPALREIELIASAEQQLRANVNMGLVFDDLAAQLATRA